VHEVDTRVEKVLAAVLATEGQLTEKDAADMVFLSLRRLRALFRRQKGVSFRNYCYHVRMESARHQLQTDSTAIETIALSLGYSSRSEFDRSFKRFYGVTPVQHRKTTAQAIYNPEPDSVRCAARYADAAQETTVRRTDP